MLQQLLNEHALDPKNPYKVYDLAQEYDRLYNGAMAISLYLKAADLCDDRVHQYKCMLGIALCYDRQGNRRYTVEGAYMDAAAILPERPEAYYHMAKFYEKGNNWKQSYFFARLGLQVDNGYFDDIGLGYPGKKALLFQRGLAKWYITGTQEGKHELFDLKFKTLLDDEYKSRVDTLLNNIFYPDTIPYTQDDFHRLKFTFPDAERVYSNYSKHFQDMFVLSVLDGKKGGTYLEIGSGDPFIHNNTALLEKEFSWKGISIDNSPGLCYNFRQNRHNTVICADATEIGYRDLFDKHCVDNVIDYLQIDCDEASIEILKRLPLESHKFGVITFEHDAYRLGTGIRDEARSILEKHGYVLLVNDLAFTELCSYEDWYVHPDIVNIKPEMRTKKDINFVWDYFMEELTKENERLI